MKQACVLKQLLKIVSWSYLNLTYDKTCCKKLSTSSAGFFFDPMHKSENAESVESFIKSLPTLSVIFTN